MLKGKIGITTTIPVEVIFAAGYSPVDLNNAFITNPSSYDLVEEAEASGFPRNSCAWIKGIYSTVASDPEYKAIIAVTQGDCSNTQALMEVLKAKQVKVIQFAYPADRDKARLQSEIDKLIAELGTSWQEVNRVKDKLDVVRSLAHEIDRLTWQENVVPGEVNHLSLVNLSDFKGDFQSYEDELKVTISSRNKSSISHKIRLGFIGVPPIFTDFYQFVEGLGAQIVYNEVQHQFSMPLASDSLLDQYISYTYPYGISTRLEAIKDEVRRRKLDGIIHYVQSFCFHHIEDLVVREELEEIPLLTLEGDKPGTMDSRSKLRVEAFCESISERKNKCLN